MIDTVTFMNLLHRGGSFHYLWRWEGKESTWRPTSATLPDVSGKVDYYFGVHPTSCVPPTNAKGEPKPPEQVRGQTEVIEAVNCLFAEFDGKDFCPNDPRGKGLALALAHIDSLPSAPTVLIRSGGGFHAYWVLRDTWLLHTPEEREKAERVQFAWVDHVGGDKAAKDLARVLRVPGTRNGKYPDKPLVEIVEYDPLRVYTLDELTEGLNLSDVSSSPPNTQENHERGPALMLDDERILTLARKASNGAKFERLWAGDLSDYGGDHSSADAGLCALLAFYTREPAQLDRLFRSSGLMRPKWDAVHYADGSTYGAVTISRALKVVTTQYDPAHNGNGHALEEPDWMNETPSPLGNEAALSIASLPEGRNEIPPMGEPRAATLEIISADDLLTTEWPEPEWVVPGLFPVGLTLLAGRPKVGKSWLALQLAQAVATGGKFLGQRVKQGRVLYLALEDARRRIAERMSLQGWSTGGGVCDFVTIGGLQKVGFLNKGGGAALAETIRAKQYRLVIVDTLSRAISGDQNDSREMTRAIAPLQVLAHEMGIGLVVLDHHNKLGAANPHSGGGSEGETPIDPVVNILGSTAKAALADCVMGLYKTPDKKGAVLAITGRDVEERAIAMQLDRQTGLWHGDGSPSVASLTDTRRRVLEAVKRHPNGVGCSTLAEILGRNRGTVRRDLQHLCSLFLVERQDDTYYPLFEEKEEIGNAGNAGNGGNAGNAGNGRGVASVACVAGVARHGNATPAPVAVAEFDPGDELPEIDDDELPF
jgi:hypothetical protein